MGHELTKPEKTKCFFQFGLNPDSPKLHYTPHDNMLFSGPPKKCLFLGTNFHPDSFPVAFLSVPVFRKDVAKAIGAGQQNGNSLEPTMNNATDTPSGLSSAR